MKRYVLIIAFLLGWATVAHAKMVSVAGALVSMYSGPGDNYEVVWELGKGYPLEVINQQENWLQVVDYQNDTGWVKENQVSERAYMIVNTEVANIRSGPGENFPLVRQAWQGVVFRSLETKGAWVKVQHEEENVTGWVLKRLMWGW